MKKIAIAVLFLFGCGVDSPAPAPAAATQGQAAVTEEISPEADGLTSEDMNLDGQTPYTCALAGGTCSTNADCCGSTRGMHCYSHKCSAL